MAYGSLSTTNLPPVLPRRRGQAVHAGDQSLLDSGAYNPTQLQPPTKLAVHRSYSIHTHTLATSILAKSLLQGMRYGAHCGSQSP